MNHLVVILASALLLTLFTTTGCGSAGAKSNSKPKPRASIDEDLAALAPIGLNQAIWLKLSPFRNSPLWAVAEIFSTDKKISDLRDHTGIDPLTQINEILIVSGTLGDQNKEEFMALVKGDFDTEVALQKAATLRPVTSLEIHGLKGLKEKEFAVIPLTQRTFAIGTLESVKQSAKLASGKGQSLRQTPAFETFSIPSNMAATLRLRDKDLYRKHSKIAGLAVSAWKWKQSITAIDATMALTNGLKLELAIDVETLENAGTAQRDLSQFKNKIAKNPLVMLFGVNWFFKKINLSNESSIVNITVTLDASDLEELRTLAERLKKIKDLANPPDEVN